MPEPWVFREKAIHWNTWLVPVLLWKVMLLHQCQRYLRWARVCIWLSPFKDKADGGGDDFMCVAFVGEKKGPGRYSQVSAFFLSPPSYCCRFPHWKRNFTILFQGTCSTHPDGHLGDPKTRLQTPQAAFLVAGSLLLWVHVFHSVGFRCDPSLFYSTVCLPWIQRWAQLAVLMWNLNNEMVRGKIKTTNAAVNIPRCATLDNDQSCLLPLSHFSTPVFLLYRR